ncbi:MAG: Hsp20/alpha crystallin family protein [Gammaproteobacteria bacterium]|jgi:HSP20 family protein
MSNNVNVTSQDTETSRADSAMLPSVDVLEDAGGITLYADLPGVPRDKLNLQVDADALTVEGEMGFATPSDMVASHVEVDVPRYRRVFTLSRELDGAKVSAEFRNGVLKLRIPKAEHAQPRKIEVKLA